ncbi:MAG TPA: hypothetical protein VIX11_14145 [Candidatus Acidoferrum sp.]
MLRLSRIFKNYKETGSLNEQINLYGTTILIFLAVLSVNLFGAALAIGRRFLLKNTGRKLSHLDKQFNVSHADMPVPVNEEDFN